MKRLLLTLLLSASLSGLAQAPAAQVPAKPQAQLTLSQASVTAGDTVQIDLNNLESPAPCSTSVQAIFDPDNPGPSSPQLVANGNIQPNSTSTSLSLTLAKDVDAGNYHLIVVRFLPCPGLSKMRTVTVPRLALSVKALPDTTKYPTRADLNLTVTQMQFFDTKIKELDDIDHQLTNRIEGHAADTADLRAILTDSVNAADRALTVTEQKYFADVMGGKGTPPALFADFHARYHELLTEFKAPIPGAGPGTTAEVASPGHPVLIRAQLKKRPAPAQPESFSASYPSDVRDTRQAYADNKAAYGYVAANDRVTFDIQFKSIPSGAHISYQKLIDPGFTDYSQPTDVALATFELATYKFKFHSDVCADDQTRIIDPYQDTKPVLSVEFSHCRGR
jgi:hypothetical protein